MDDALRLLDGERLQVEEGPISLVLSARWGEELRPEELRAAGSRAREVLAELGGLRRLLATPVSRIRNPAALPPAARAMWEATLPFQDRFVTPLAAVAGAVSDAVADYLWERGATRISVNNGGDIALRLAPGEAVTVGLARSLRIQGPSARFRVESGSGVGGVATSGFGGRSFTLGIADAVTVLAETGAQADAAATLVANEVRLDSPSVVRELAQEIDPDTDLLGILVTRSVGPLSAGEIKLALERGVRAARELLDRGLIRGALLALRGRWRFAGLPGESGIEWLGGRNLEDQRCMGGERWKSESS